MAPLFLPHGGVYTLPTDPVLLAREKECSR